MAKIVHIVMFQFKADTSADAVKQHCEKMLLLRQQCIHPETQKPYIRTSMGGSDNSPEGNQGGLTHAFVVEFDSEADRGYYLEKDPAHIAFVENVGKHIEQVRVVDFTPGVF